LKKSKPLFSPCCRFGTPQAAFEQRLRINVF